MTDPQRAVLDKVAALPVTVTASETLTAAEFSYPWSASVEPVGPFWLDDRTTDELDHDDLDHDADQLCGFGATRHEALVDLDRMLSRVTYLVAHSTNLDRGMPRIVEAAPDRPGGPLRPVREGP